MRPPIPVTTDIDPLLLLIDDAVVAGWNNEGLPSDRMSTENATILTCCERWPLMIDPQLQGIKWIKQRYGDPLQVIRLDQKQYLDKTEQAIVAGDVLLLENIDESIEAVLDPLLGRNTIKKGRAIKSRDKEIEYHPGFRLILQTKLANPHYKPEMQAQTTLINFTVTKDGLEDQLLADVVAKFDGELYLAPGFLIPPSTDYKGYHQYIDEFIPPESPNLYGLHPHAEIDFLTTTFENLFKTVLEMQPRDAGEGQAMTREGKIKSKLDEILDKLPDEFPVRELYAKAEEKTPYTVVALQECERMSLLTRDMRRSLKELNLGLKINSLFIMPKGYEFSQEVKQLMFHIINFVESGKNDPVIPLYNVNDRLVKMFGISERSVRRLKQEFQQLR
ncbi:unnamed protein product [Didymodactylos carnosus]|uniref:Dynein heavy chain n=2 Tax=Didymodactylos carnosus TaxID=1234261 RepID=A0A814RXW8_9BILA|nr:unnamed protein product [Didymodactylos carnosus]CAF3903864.1 unnamed protein product [Didymodactylos carnosus]